MDENTQQTPLQEMLDFRRLGEMREILSGKVLRRAENQSGEGFYWEKSKSLFLYEDGSFSYEEKTVKSVSAAGLSMPSESKTIGRGTWTVEIVRGDVALVLRQEGSVVLCSHAENGGKGIQYLAGERWERYVIQA